jgi:hypothetical protein
VLTRDALHVDDRRLAGDGDGLFESANPHLRVDRRGEVADDLNAFTPERVEPGQRENDSVGAGRQAHDPVLTTPVRHDRTNFLDQRRARCFDGHARQHGA